MITFWASFMVDCVGFAGPAGKGDSDSAAALTLQVLSEVHLRHVVINLAPLVCRDVSRRVVALFDKLAEEGIDLALEGLPVQCALHCVRGRTLVF